MHRSSVADEATSSRDTLHYMCYERYPAKIHINGKNMMLFGHKALQRVEMLSFDHGARRQGASYRVRGCA